MLDIRLIAEDPEPIKDSIKKRGSRADVEALLSLYQRHKSLLMALEQQRAEANRIAKAIPQATDKVSLVAKGRDLNHQIAELEQELRVLDESYQEALLSLPNLLPEDTPLGETDAQNLVLRTWGDPITFDFKPKDHLELGKSLDLIDFDSGSKVAGAKFYFLKNEAVLLELALKLFAMKVAASFGYTTLITPDVAKKSILAAAGFSPKGEESNIYHLEELDLGLIATAEITVAGLHVDELLDESALPLKYVAESHCFRREAGASGRESKGLYRVHQFSKIELFQVTRPEDAESALEEILAIEESIYQKLGLPYRVVRICSGDLGAPAYKKYDLEAWMPGRDSAEKYGEITSASNCTDYQSRRLNLRYRNKEKKKIHPYTLNGTAVALSRTLMAILECYQQRDGSVLIPEVLQAYVGKTEIRR